MEDRLAWRDGALVADGRWLCRVAEDGSTTMRNGQLVSPPGGEGDDEPLTLSVVVSHSLGGTASAQLRCTRSPSGEVRSHGHTHVLRAHTHAQN
jgi:hypothetical protein